MDNLIDNTKNIYIHTYAQELERFRTGSRNTSMKLNKIVQHKSIIKPVVESTPRVRNEDQAKTSTEPTEI